MIQMLSQTLRNHSQHLSVSLVNTTTEQATVKKKEEEEGKKKKSDSEIRKHC